MQKPRLKLGRWIYCKYCYEKVKPELGSIFQVVCSQCGSGLTPDFASEQGLIHWLNGKEDLANSCKEEQLAMNVVREELSKRNYQEEFEQVKRGHERLVFVDNHTPQYGLRKISRKLFDKRIKTIL